MDRNTVIGFVLIGALLIAMFVINSQSRLAYEGEQRRIADSIAALKKTQPAAVQSPTAQATQTTTSPRSGAFQQDTTGEKNIVLENAVMKVGFSSKGGRPKYVEMKNYKTFNGAPVVVQSGEFNSFSYRINT